LHPGLVSRVNLQKSLGFSVLSDRRSLSLGGLQATSRRPRASERGVFVEKKSRVLVNGMEWFVVFGMLVAFVYLRDGAETQVEVDPPKPELGGISDILKSMN